MQIVRFRSPAGEPQVGVERDGQLGRLNLELDSTLGSLLRLPLSELKRRLEDLVSYLFRADDFPEGVVLSTGTALVPDTPFTLQPGDEVEIAIDRLGSLRNPVIRR